MPFHSQRTIAFSDGDAAVLIRAMNRQRVDGATVASRQGAPTAQRTSNPLPFKSFVGGTSGEGPVQVVGRRSVRAMGADELVGRRGRGGDAPVSDGRGASANVRVLRGGRRPSDADRHAMERDRGGDVPRRARRGRTRGDDADGRSNRRARTRDTGLSGILPAIAAWFTGLAPRTRHCLAVIGCIAAVIAFFYAPTADLYAAARDHDQLEAKVAATNAVAADLKAEIERLQTEEGVMDEARIRGYARPDEIAADASELLGIEDTVTVPELSKPIETEEPPLYVQFLDVILGYEEHV